MENKKVKGRYQLKVNDERYILYREYIDSQRQEFENAIKELQEIIKKLEQGIKIGEETIKLKGKAKIEARIKSFKSAIKNDCVDRKVLDDCFGIRIVSDSILDLECIRQTIKRINIPVLRGKLEIGDEETKYYIVKEKNHAEREKTEYNAIHQVAIRNRNNVQSPLIEIQYWDTELEKRCTKGDLRHDSYKSEEYREMLKGNVGIELPEFYLFDENGNLMILSKEETLRKMFPCLEAKEGKDDR